MSSAAVVISPLKVKILQDYWEFNRVYSLIHSSVCARQIVIHFITCRVHLGKEDV